MVASHIKVKNFTCSSYGVFENGEFITTCDSWEEMIDRATTLSHESGNTCSIATLQFEGTEEDPKVKEGVVIMKFSKVKDTIYITNQLD